MGIFSLFHVDLNEPLTDKISPGKNAISKSPSPFNVHSNTSGSLGEESFTLENMSSIVPGPPFVFGALLVILALMVAAFIPEAQGHVGEGSRNNSVPSGGSQKGISPSGSVRRHFHERKKKSDDDDDSSENE